MPSRCWPTASSAHRNRRAAREWLRVAVLRLPRISNSTDVEALACEPGVLVRWVSEPADLADTDVVVLPGTKSTVADLGWLRERGLDQAIAAHAASGPAGVGHLRRIPDAVPLASTTRSKADRAGSRRWAMLDVDIAFAPDKVLRRWQGSLQRLRDPSWPGGPLRRGRVVRGRRIPAGVSARPGLRDALARPVRQRRLPPAVVDRRRRGSRPGRIRGSRRHRCRGAARCASSIYGRSVGRPPRRRRRHRRCWTMARRRVRPLLPPCADRDSCRV